MNSTNSTFYKKYQNIIDDFINKNQNYIDECYKKYPSSYIMNNEKQFINIKIFMKNLPNNLKNNYPFFLDAVEYNAFFLKYASDNLKNNYQLVFNALEQDELVLKYASDNLKNNYKIILHSVNNFGRSLFYYSDRLKKNYRIVLFAVQDDGAAFKYASDDLKNNYNIALNAILNDNGYTAILYLPPKFIKNRKLIVNINNNKYRSPSSYYNENKKIIEIIDYKFKIKKNILLNESLNNIFIFF